MEGKKLNNIINEMEQKNISVPCCFYKDVEVNKDAVFDKYGKHNHLSFNSLCGWTCDNHCGEDL